MGTEPMKISGAQELEEGEVGSRGIGASAAKSNETTT